MYCSVFVLQVWRRAGRSLHGSSAGRWLCSSEESFKWGWDLDLHMLCFFLMHQITGFPVLTVFLLVITDQKKGSVVRASFSSWFWFRTRNSCLVSIRTPAQKKAQSKTGTFSALKKIFVSVFPLQGIALLLGWHLEGDGVCGQVRAHECPCRAASQRSEKRVSRFCFSSSQKLSPLQVCFVSLVFSDRWWRKSRTTHQASLLQTVPSCLSKGDTEFKKTIVMFYVYKFKIPICWSLYLVICSCVQIKLVSTIFKWPQKSWKTFSRAPPYQSF